PGDVQPERVVSAFDFPVFESRAEMDIGLAVVYQRRSVESQRNRIPLRPRRRRGSLHGLQLVHTELRTSAGKPRDTGSDLLVSNPVRTPPAGRISPARKLTP